MELFFVFLTLLLAVSICLALRQFRSRLAAAGHGSPLPPGSFGFPVVGETLQFLAAHKKGASENFVLHRANKYSSRVFKTSLFGENFAVLSGAAANKFLFANDAKHFTRWRPGTVQKLFPSTRFVPIEHDARKARKFISLFFKFDAAQSLVATVDAVTCAHLGEHWAGREEVKVYPLVKLYTFALACRLFMTVDDTDRVLRLMRHFSLLAGGMLSVPVNVPGSQFHGAIKAADVLRREIGLIIAERREALAANTASPTQDVLSEMLTERDEGGEMMTELEISDKILAFLIASHETTAAVITFSMKYLAEMPHLYAQVLREQIEITTSMKPREELCWDDIQKMSFTWNFVCEVMRHRTMIQGAFREAATDVNFDGFVIPKGWKVYWSISLTQKNPEYFLEPETFNPSRFEDKESIVPHTFVPFGGGPLMCPGKEYTRVEILVFLHHVLKMFKWEASIPNEKIKYEMTPFPVEGFPVRLCHLQN